MDPVYKETIITRLLTYDAERFAVLLRVSPSDPEVLDQLRELRVGYESLSLDDLKLNEQWYLRQGKERQAASRSERRISGLKKKAAVAGAMLGAGLAADFAGIDKWGGLENAVIVLSEVVGFVGLTVNGVKIHLARIERHF